MALLTYLFAFAHFSSEILIFRTAKINIPVLSPVVVASAYHLFVKDLRDLMIVLSHDLPPSFFFFYSYLTCMDDLAIRLLRKSMTPTHLHMASPPNNSIQSHPSLRL
jgi:Erg28 like protein